MIERLPTWTLLALNPVLGSEVIQRFLGVFNDLGGFPFSSQEFIDVGSIAHVDVRFIKYKIDEALLNLSLLIPINSI